MKKVGIKLFSLVLAALMMISCMVVAGMSVSAATSSAGDVVYFDNSVTNFSTVYCYMWSDGQGSNADWPGEAMTKMSGDIWAYNVKSDYDNIIFNGGNGAIQSKDITYNGNNQVATPKSNSDKFEVSWADYTGTETIPTSATTPSSATTPTSSTSDTTPSAPSGDLGSVYCQNDAGWSTVYCYMWTDGQGNNASWPGVAMTDLGDGVWEYSPTKSFSMVIFNNGGGTQTGNINYPGGGQICSNVTCKWEPYNAGPVKITSLATDLKSPAYSSCSIVISAAAKSTEGDLTYKFTIRDSGGGETVISEGASSSVTWIPTSPDTYTIQLDVTDTSGNTASRSTTFVINDATTLETAFISAFSNSLGTRTQIKQNTSITFTTTALGGHTGNGLLFYKFVVTDPDGSGNTAYYTTSNSYTLTPTKLGTYTIKTFVQNSYNKTVNSTYTYDCVAEINEDATSTNPPVTTPTPSVTVPPSSSTTPTSPTSPSSATDPSSSDSVVTPKLGDVNKDGNVNVNDATAIQKYVASFTVSNFDASLADTNKDGTINIKDATVIQKYIAGIIKSI